MRSPSSIAAFLPVVLLSLCGLISAQTSTTSLRGTITDQKGAVVTGATVTISDAATGFSREAQTDNEGVYQFLQLRPATYTVTVRAAGFPP